MAKEKDPAATGKVRVKLKSSVRLHTMAVGLPGPDALKWFGDGHEITMSAEDFEKFKLSTAPSSYEVVG